MEKKKKISKDDAKKIKRSIKTIMSNERSKYERRK